MTMTTVIKAYSYSKFGIIKLLLCLDFKAYSCKTSKIGVFRIWNLAGGRGRSNSLTILKSFQKERYKI